MDRLILPNSRWVANEASLMAELFHAAKVASVDLFLEVKIPSGYHTSGLMRVDGAAVLNDEVYCLVEAKRPGKALIEHGRQWSAYKDALDRYGVPTYWINAHAQIGVIIDAMVKLKKEAVDRQR